MRGTLWLLAATSALAILPAMGPQDAAPPVLTAAQILQRVDETYAKARSYRDAGVVERVLTLPQAGKDFPPSREVTPFRTAFLRSGSFRFECGPASGDLHGRFLFARSEGRVQAWSEKARETEHATTLGAAVVVASADSFEVSVRIPKLLVPLEVVAPSLTSNLAQATRLADVESDGLACFVLQGVIEDRIHKIADCALWIDQQSFLVRRLELKTGDLGVKFTTTATYEPEIDVEIGAGELAFDPPKELKPRARDVEAAKVRASNPPELSEALKLSMKGQHDEALIELDRLWEVAAPPGWEDQPLSSTEMQLLEAIGREAAEHAPTQAHFAKLFDELDTEVRGGAATMHEWASWAQLGRTLKLDDRIVKLYLERRSPEGALRPYEDMNPLAINELTDILVERKQFGDAGRLSLDPVREAKWAYKSVALSTAGLVGRKGGQRIIDEMTASARTGASRLYALTLAAGRMDEAGEIAASMLELEDSVEARRALILACLDCGLRPGAITEWLAEIGKRGGDVADLEARLAKPTELGEAKTSSKSP